MSADRLIIFDTTLRDGEQAPGFSMRIDEKLKLARQLAVLGVDLIEAGFPIASEADAESVRVISAQVRGPVIAALARCHPADIDRAGEALTAAPRRRIHTFIATSDLHLERKLRMTRGRASTRRSRRSIGLDVIPTMCSFQLKTRPEATWTSCAASSRK